MREGRDQPGRPGATLPLEAEIKTVSPDEVITKAQQDAANWLEPELQEALDAALDALNFPQG